MNNDDLKEEIKNRIKLSEIISKKKAGIPSEKSELPKTIEVINSANIPYSVGLKIFVEIKIQAKVKKAAKLLNKKKETNEIIPSELITVSSVSFRISSFITFHLVGL